MHSARENVANLWRARKGLILLLMAGTLLALLAVVTPQAWATPDQKPLADTIEDINGNPDPPDCIRQCDAPIFFSTLNDGFGPGVTVYDVTFYVTENISWTKDLTAIGDPGVVVVHQGKVDIVNGHFFPDNPALIWSSPSTGYFDLFFDVNGNLELNDGDGIVGAFGRGPGDPIWVGAGFCIEECPVGGATVPAGMKVRPLFFALAGLIAVGTGAGLVWRRRRD